MEYQIKDFFFATRLADPSVELVIANSIDKVPKRLSKAIRERALRTTDCQGEEPFRPFFIARFPATFITVADDAMFCIQRDFQGDLVVSIYNGEGRLTHRQTL